MRSEKLRHSGGNHILKVQKRRVHPTGRRTTRWRQSYLPLGENTRTNCSSPFSRRRHVVVHIRFCHMFLGLAPLLSVKCAGKQHHATNVSHSRVASSSQCGERYKSCTTMKMAQHPMPVSKSMNTPPAKCHVACIMLHCDNIVCVAGIQISSPRRRHPQRTCRTDSIHLATWVRPL